MVVDRLLAKFREGESVTSRYAASLIAVRCGPEQITKFMSIFESDSNPALDGWMLEMSFFVRLRAGGVSIRDKEGREIDTWKSDCITLGDDILKEFPDELHWIKPKKWNQGGYDAIMVNKKDSLVRFVQVTLAKKHDLRLVGKAFALGSKFRSEEAGDFHGRGRE